ncbi:MAG: DUF177 domain-containing protein [Clostridia bacterium]|nr:DUF177 domain-containing protein [Clostridia bacterium]
MRDLTLDVSPLTGGRVKEQTFSVEWTEIPEIFSGVIPAEPVSVSGSIRNRQEFYELDMTIELDFTSECARCLKPLKRHAKYSCVKSIVTHAENNDDGEYIVIDNDAVTLNEAAEELLFLELPSRLLCREDCAGLCHICGKNLNEGPCSCKKETDPRWEGLKRFLGNDHIITEGGAENGSTKA